MSVEIERKFLVKNDKWRQGEGSRISQGYLNRDKERTVRVRRTGDRAFLTIKGLAQGMARPEFEYEIPVADAEKLFALSDGPLVEKIRYRVLCNGLVWEVDEFLGDNQGLILAEVELSDEDQPFTRPVWLGEEVTSNPHYFNSNLCIHPYCKWNKA